MLELGLVDEPELVPELGVVDEPELVEEDGVVDEPLEVVPFLDTACHFLEHYPYIPLKYNFLKKSLRIMYNIQFGKKKFVIFNFILKESCF